MSKLLINTLLFSPASPFLLHIGFSVEQLSVCGNIEQEILNSSSAMDKGHTP